MAYSLVDDPISKTILRCQFNISMNSFIIFSKLKKTTSGVFSGCKYKTLFLQHPRFIFLFFYFKERNSKLGQNAQ